MVLLLAIGWLATVLAFLFYLHKRELAHEEEAMRLLSFRFDPDQAIRHHVAASSKQTARPVEVIPPDDDKAFEEDRKERLGDG